MRRSDGVRDGAGGSATPASRQGLVKLNDKVEPGIVCIRMWAR
jgi:hypothetical protein